MSNQHRSPASMQDVAREADVPAPKKTTPSLAGLIAAGIIALSMTGLIALIFTRARATAVQEATPAQTVPAAAVQWQAPGPGEVAKTGQAIQSDARVR